MNKGKLLFMASYSGGIWSNTSFIPLISLIFTSPEKLAKKFIFPYPIPCSPEINPPSSEALLYISTLAIPQDER